MAPKLQAVESRVLARLLEELFVSTAFDYGTGVQHDYPVGPANGAEPMGDDKSGAIFGEPLQRLEQSHLGLSVQRTGRFVEN